MKISNRRTFAAEAFPRVYNRPGSRGHRNAENTANDENDNQEVDTSGNKIGKRVHTRKSPPAFETRGQRLASGEKRARSQSEERPSAREQSRGRSEHRGQLNKRVNQGASSDRIGRTGSKGRASVTR